MRATGDRKMVQKMGKHALVLLSYLRRKSNLFGHNEIAELLRSPAAKIIGIAVAPINMKARFLSVS
jgi:hypothetical protein